MNTITANEILADAVDYLASIGLESHLETSATGDSNLFVKEWSTPWAGFDSNKNILWCSTKKKILINFFNGQTISQHAECPKTCIPEDVIKRLNVFA